MEDVEEFVACFADNEHDFNHFMRGVVDYFSLRPTLRDVVHSLKSRLKDKAHLRDKLVRKPSLVGTSAAGLKRLLSVNDLAGVRVLHLHRAQFGPIHEAITKKIGEGDWALAEPPKAYSWDPDNEPFYAQFDIKVEVKESSYTSVHYVVKPRKDSHISCEIQVRTLFEEVWGEVDHAMNYPKATSCLSSKEQLKVLARLVSTGTRLADSIFVTEAEFRKKSQ